MTRIGDIAKHGQSIWYDFIQRSMIWSGALYRMVEEDGLKGVTSNPAIFEKAISKSRDYAPAMASLVRAGASPLETFEHLAFEDIQLATDVLRKVYDETDARDGFVSLEVSPHLAYQTMPTIEEALRLWELVSRENLMIKIPATEEGLVAIEQVIAEGINVNVTLLFSVERYEEVVAAYMTGLEKLVEAGGDPSRVASVASFFVSRIDSLIDKKLDERLAASGDEKKIAGLRGKTAVANAKMAYRSYERLMASDRWKKLESKGARPQRLLWASTSTKNPDYRDVLYLEELIATNTVNTVPAATYDAFQDHGEVKSDRIKHDLEGAEATLGELREVDISLTAVTDQLLEEGVVLFQQAFDRLMGTVEQRRAEVLGGQLSRMTIEAGDAESSIQERLKKLNNEGFGRRLWARDGGLWPDGSASEFLGWLEAVDDLREHAEHFIDLQEDLENEGVEHVVLMGMGGSSLAPDVFARTFGTQAGSPELLVLDSTVPAQVRALEKRIDPRKTLFVVASKSGTTIEPLAFDNYFFAKVGDGNHFMAITDPDSKLEALALERDYRAVFSGDPEIGGRYSALSPFGMVPASAMGMDVLELLGRARLMVGSCEAAVPCESNSGVRLGVTLGELAQRGRDKLTIVATPGLVHFGAWVEQLVAESTGKAQKGIVPVDRETLAEPSTYGNDRVFAYLKLSQGEDEAAVRELDAGIDALKKAGHPVITIELANKKDIVQEMFRWELATATAGHVLEINPFDQPNVQESKSFTVKLLDQFKASKTLPAVEGEVRLLEENGIVAYTDEGNQAAFAGKTSLRDLLSSHLDRAVEGDYIAFNAYVEMSEENDRLLQALRHHARAAKKVATTVGYGPRFLHSTGQLHKGGANNGVYLQITCEDGDDLEIPGHGYSFGVLKNAQQAGDFLALSKRERRMLRVHLPADVKAGLEILREALSG